MSKRPRKKLPDQPDRSTRRVKALVNSAWYVERVVRQEVLARHDVIYRSYMVSSHWRSMVALYRADTCLLCGSRRGLALHHVTYRNLFKETADDFVTLCHGRDESCHRLVHDLAAGTLDFSLDPRRWRSDKDPRAVQVAVLQGRTQEVRSGRRKDVAIVLRGSADLPLKGHGVATSDRPAPAGNRAKKKSRKEAYVATAADKFSKRSGRAVVRQADESREQFARRVEGDKRLT